MIEYVKCIKSNTTMFTKGEKYRVIYEIDLNKVGVITNFKSTCDVTIGQSTLGNFVKMEKK